MPAPHRASPSQPAFATIAPSALSTPLRRLHRWKHAGLFRFKLPGIGLDDAGAVISAVIMTARIDADRFARVARQGDGGLHQLTRHHASPIVRNNQYIRRSSASFMCSGGLPPYGPGPLRPDRDRRRTSAGCWRHSGFSTAWDVRACELRPPHRRRRLLHQVNRGVAVCIGSGD
jgi:hypothetical protein